jgi:uncharacterized protein (TIGR03435 family)
MKSPLLNVAIAGVRGWTRLYTWRMPAESREVRRAEIESDLWEFQQDAVQSSFINPAAHVLIRLLVGIPDDLRWRMDQAGAKGTRAHRNVALSASACGAVLFACALWAIDTDAARKRSAFAFTAPTIALEQAKRTPLAAGIVATVGASMMPRLSARWATPLPGGPAFETVSITPTTSGSPLVTMTPQAGGRFMATNVSLGMLIGSAYQLLGFEILGGPDWLESARFDVAASAGYDAPVTHMRLMLQTLLAERFKLRADTQTRELPVYALLMARSDGRLGPQLRRTPLSIDCYAAPTPPPGEVPPTAALPPCGFFGLASDRSNLAFRGMTMEAIGRLLKPMVGRNVIDRTGRAGHFDGDFDFSAELGPPPPSPGTPDPFDRQSFPTISTVVQEQLGLKLESQRAPVDVLVIDSAQQPAPD